MGALTHLCKKGGGQTQPEQHNSVLRHHVVIMMVISWINCGKTGHSGQYLNADSGRLGELVEVLANGQLDVAIGSMCTRETRWKGNGRRFIGSKGK